MNAARAPAPGPIVAATETTPAITTRLLADMIAPRDHGGIGNWDKNTEIPWQAWPLGIAFAAFFIWGWDLLNWLLRFVL